MGSDRERGGSFGKPRTIGEGLPQTTALGASSSQRWYRDRSVLVTTPRWGTYHLSAHKPSISVIAVLHILLLGPAEASEEFLPAQPLLSWSLAFLRRDSSVCPCAFCPFSPLSNTTDRVLLPLAHTGHASGRLLGKCGPHGPRPASRWWLGAGAGGLEKARWLFSLPFVTSKVCPSQALTRTCCELTSGQRAPQGPL